VQTVEVLASAPAGPRMFIEEKFLRGGIPAELLPGVYQEFRDTFKDTATGLWNNSFRYRCLEEAQRWQAAHPCYVTFYAEFDVKNVGGGNAELGHSTVNEKILRPIAQILERRTKTFVLERLGSCDFFRHGGDELSARISFLPSEQSPRAELELCFEECQDEIMELSYRENLSLLLHPKKVFTPSQWGIGISFGTSYITAYNPDGSVRTIPQILKEADKRTERNKLLGYRRPPFTFGERVQIVKKIVRHLVK